LHLNTEWTRWWQTEGNQSITVYLASSLRSLGGYNNKFWKKIVLCSEPGHPCSSEAGCNMLFLVTYLLCGMFTGNEDLIPGYFRWIHMVSLTTALVDELWEAQLSQRDRATRYTFS